MTIAPEEQKGWWQGKETEDEVTKPKKNKEATAATGTQIGKNEREEIELRFRQDNKQQDQLETSGHHNNHNKQQE